MTNTAELISTVTYAISEVSRGVARVPANFGLLVARFLQSNPLNFTASAQVVAAHTHRIIINDFKNSDWFIDVYIKDDFSFRLDGPYVLPTAAAEDEAELGEEEVAVAPEHDVAGAMSTLTDALQADPSYTWGWQCNLAMAIIDELKVSHSEGNRAAARILQHFFKVDVTGMKEYIDIVPMVKADPKRVALHHVVPGDGPDNVIHITVTGFQENSGAEALAQRLPLFLQGGGFTHELSLADTTLGPRQVGPVPAEKKTHVIITGVESRYHTDLLSAKDSSSDEALDTTDFGDPDPIGDVEGFSLQENRPRMKMHLRLDDDDLYPTTTVDYFRQEYPEADLEVSYKVNRSLTDHIHKLAIEESSEPEPEPVGLTKQEPEHRLSDADARRNAYLFQNMVGDDRGIALMHVDIDEPGFDVEQILGEGWLIVHHGSIEAFTKLVRKMGNDSVLEHATELYCNNERWLNKFGDGSEVVPRKHEGGFTLFNISQGSIPKAIADEVEDAWIAFQDTDRLRGLAGLLDDPSIIITNDEYVKVTRGGCMVVREHPRVEELFLKYLQFKATQNQLIRRWLQSFGK